MRIEDYAEYDALALAELVRNKEVRPSELAEAAIAGIEKHNPRLNAVIRPAFELGRETAARHEAAPGRGVLQGVPFLLKDVLGFCEGLPVTSGSRLLQGQGDAGHDSELVRRFREAGLVILGRTNAPELGILPTTEPAAYGASCNPWNPSHSTGGSSGGSAAAVAAGIVPAAHANDGGGSIRIPASCCGLVGMKPTRARNSLAPDFGDLISGLVCEHVVTRSVRDSAAILDVTHGPAPGDPYWAPPVQRAFLSEVAHEAEPLRIAFSRNALDGTPLHAHCVAGVEAAAGLCESLGHSVEEATPPVDAQAFIEAFMPLWASGVAAGIDSIALARGAPPTEDELEGLTWGLYHRGREVTAVEYQLAVGALQLTGRTMARFHATYDVWLTPVLGAPPLHNGVIDVRERDPDKAFAPILEYCPFTAIQNATGQPSISLPLYWNEAGLPIGLMFSARFGEEGMLYRLAGQLERARPWSGRRPPIWG